MVEFVGKLVGKYTVRPMDPMGFYLSRNLKDTQRPEAPFFAVCQESMTLRASSFVWSSRESASKIGGLPARWAPTRYK